MPPFGAGGGTTGVPRNFKGLPIVRGLNDGSPYAALGSPSVFTDGAAEAGLATDAQAVAADFAGARVETGALAEGNAATADMLGARVESGTASEGNLGTADFGGARAESGTAADLQAGPAIFATACAEVLSGVDVSDATVTAGAVVYDVAVTEFATAADSQSGPALFSGARAEAGTAVDAQPAPTDLVGAISEAMAGVDTPSASGTFVAAMPETLAASEAATGDIAGPPVVYDVAVAELLTLTDAADASLVVPALEFGGSNGYATPNRRTFTVEQRDALALAERRTATALMTGDQQDALSAVDGVVGASALEASALDAFYLVERHTAQTERVGLLHDTVDVHETQESAATFEGVPPEQLAALDELLAGVDFAASRGDALTAADGQTCELLRGPRFTPPAAWSPAQDEFTAEEEEAFLTFLMTA